MLLALGLLALLALWWLGRNGRLPFGLTPKRLYAYAVFLAAGALALRGSLVLGGLVALGGLWLLEGPDNVARRLKHLFGRRSPEPEIVRTATIEFQVFQDAVPPDGVILVGPRSGTRLSQASPAALLALRELCRQGDPEGARLLEAYLDGRHPGWRVDAERDPDPRAGAPLQPGAMTEEEAYQVLGLERGASLEEIRAAHRTLMKRLHPDQGGTAERAARVNAARDRLTNRHR